MLRRLALATGSVLLAGCSVFGVRSGYEQAAYEVVDRVDPRVEIRRYGPRLVAETSVEAVDRQAGQNAAFRILADYIFGGNRGSQEVAMTVPVEVEPAGTEIAMTAPVETEASGDRLVMRFFLPARFTRENAPEPVDPRVRIVELPGETVAVLGFSGLGRAGSVERHEGLLLEALEGSRWSIEGTPRTLYYDPPWTLPFLRRNEASVRVSPAPRG